jgi:hypothetical protein
LKGIVCKNHKVEISLSIENLYFNGPFTFLKSLPKAFIIDFPLYNYYNINYFYILF